MAKLLLITPDEHWAQVSIEKLDKYYEGDFALTGKDGQLKIYKNAYEYIFINLDTTNNSGLEVIRYVRTSHPGITIFAIVGGKTLEELGLSESLLKKLGVREILKDFAAEKINEPLKSLGKVKKWESVEAVDTVKGEESEATLSDTNFTRIKIDEFFQDAIAIFDFYIRLGSNRYIKIIHKGEVSSSAQIKKYADSGAKYLYFLAEDRADFISYQNELTKRQLQGKEINEARILKNMKTATDKYIEEVFVQGIQPQLIEEGKAICQNMFEFTQKDKSLRKILGRLEEFDPAAYSHSFLVCFFSAVISKNLDWVGTRTKEALSLGAMFHDIGLVQLPDTILQKKTDSMSEDELAIFKEHPKKGLETLDGIPSITSSIQQIVLQHHELSNGAGFPAGLSASKIFPLAKIVGLADSFSEFLTEREVSPLDGIKEFLNARDTLVGHDSELIRSLVKGFISENKRT